MKAKRIFSFMLIVSMFFSLAIVPAFAVIEGSFPFKDVKVEDWYYYDVKYAYDNDLINGKTLTTFEPGQNLTYAEAVKLAACMHQKYTTGSVTLANGSPWYQPYVEYCEEFGILSKQYDWQETATRAGYMEIFAKALPAHALEAINPIEEGAIPDVSADHPQSKAIYTLYRAGIVQGSDEQHNCYPDSNIQRSEVAAILSRMMKPENRVAFEIDIRTSVPSYGHNLLSFYPFADYIAIAFCYHEDSTEWNEFSIDKVSVNGIECTLDIMDRAAIEDRLAAAEITLEEAECETAFIGSYIMFDYDAAVAASSEYVNGDLGYAQPVLAFSFDVSGRYAGGRNYSESFTIKFADLAYGGYL